MDNSEKWNLFCELVNKYKMDKEDNIQRLFEQIFAELFGYSRLWGEIDAHRVLHIGSTDRVIPDIIIRNATENKDLFIVELKQLNKRKEEDFEEQLFSYMKLLSLDVGILICDAVYVCIKENNKLCLTEIDFSKDSERGETFVELFSKGEFSIAKVKEFVLQSYVFEKNVQKIKDEIDKLSIKGLVKSHLLNSYKENEIDKALSDFVFRVDKANKPLIKPVSPNGPTDPPISGCGELIQDWVKRIFTYLLKNGILSQEMINDLHNKEYSQRTFGVAYAMFVDVQTKTIISGHSRYWQKPIGGYYICSQWWKSDDVRYHQNICRWLDEVLPDYVERGLNRR